MSYTPRVVDDELDELLQTLTAVAVEGPKGVGKTATAARRATTVFRLDEPAHREVAAAEPSVLLQAAPPVLNDEWQHVPAVWDAVRRAVDGGAPPNQYLLAGSAVPKNLPTHSGAGRIVTLRMRPLALGERGLAPPAVSLRDLLAGTRSPIGGTSHVDLAGYTTEIVRSGFPGLRHLTGRALRASLDGYLDRAVDRDIEEQGYTVRRPATLKRWMAAYAAATGMTTSLEKIRNAATSGDGNIPNRATVTAYHHILQRLWLVEPVPGWTPTRNHLGRLAQAPKHQLADPALAARLLGADERALLSGMASTAATPRDGALLGQLFDSLVTLSVRVYAQAAEARVRHLRTMNGRQEIDLIVERDDHRVLPIEIKLSGTVTDDDVKHLHWLREQMGDDVLDAVVVTTGPHAYRRSDGIAVVPAALLGP
jgi:predicted AAA+ superfamily ATPase